MDFSSSLITTGVDRYLESLLSGIKGFKITWLRIRTDRKIIIHQEERTQKYTKIEIPLPENEVVILGEQYWSKQYFEVVMYILNRYVSIRTVSIVHVHTLNLIDLAIRIKEVSGCKVITHLHCIPWKQYFNGNKSKFNYLYTEYYINKNYNADLFRSNCNELDAYLLADKLVCLTQSAREFIQHITRIEDQKLLIINNGIRDTMQNNNRKLSEKDGVIRVLYVGALTESKGILTVLNVMHKIQRLGYAVELIVAGVGTEIMNRQITPKLSGLNVKMLGQADFKTLSYYYEHSDIGCISSLQEQASYVAIEMAMFGLPVVTTAIDGLDEMFVDEESALKIGVTFHPYLGLQINEGEMVAALKRLIDSPKLRAKIAAGVRRRYKECFMLNTMIEATENLYHMLN